MSIAVPKDLYYEPERPCSETRPARPGDECIWHDGCLPTPFDIDELGDLVQYLWCIEGECVVNTTSVVRDFGESCLADAVIVVVSDQCAGLGCRVSDRPRPGCVRTSCSAFCATDDDCPAEWECVTGLDNLDPETDDQGIELGVCPPIAGLGADECVP